MLALAITNLLLTLLNAIALGVLALSQYRRLQRRGLNKPSADLSDFLSDVKIHGYGVVRLDPDALMYRGRK